MNPETAVSVHGYSGDVQQVNFMMPYYQHHRVPVYIVSPTDAPINKQNIVRSARGGEVSFLTGGARQYTGELSLIRQRIHMELLLQTPHNWFLMNDADSVCLSPELPGYLYAEPDVFWSNVVSDEMHPREEGYEFPRLAFQPPYFTHRSVLEKLVREAPGLAANPRTPFIDWLLMALCVRSRVPFKNFVGGCSCPTNNYPPGIAHMVDRIQNQGATMLHSIKRRQELLTMAHARVEYKRTHR
jgi:hypothetical protein